MAGLAPGQAAELARRDREWLINGRRGIIQLVDSGPVGLRPAPRR